MEKQQEYKSSLTIEPALMDMILKPKYEKIRRPPNAFMLFARDHRRLIAVKHPNVCNKTVSTMLGKVWKSTPQNVKSKYYKKAEVLGELHKRQYPNYVYSPREARIKKMNKKKRNKEIYTDSLHPNGELTADTTKKIKDEDHLNEEEDMAAVDPDPNSVSVYVPNNPEYFIEQSCDMNSDDTQGINEQPPQCVYPMDVRYLSVPRDTMNKPVVGWDHNDKNRREQTSPETCRCCERNKFGYQEKSISPHQRPESERINPYHLDYLRYAYASPPSFCNAAGHLSRPMSPYCCSPPPCLSPGLRPYGPPFQTYWNLPTMNSSFFPSREHVYENLKPYPTSFHAPDYFGHQFGYFDRHATQFNPKSSYKFWQPLNEKSDNCQQEQNEHICKDSEAPPGFKQYNDKGNNYSHSHVGNSSADDNMVLHSERIGRTNNRNNEGMRNQNLSCGGRNRMRESENSLSSHPVTEDGIYSKVDYGDKFLQKETNNEISANNFVSRQKYMPCVADNIESKNEVMFADFSNLREQLRSHESPNYNDFLKPNSNQNNSEEISNSHRSSKSNDRNNLKNMYVSDISPNSTFSSSQFSPIIQSFSTPAMNSDSPNNIIQEECDKSLSKLDERSICESLQNNIFTHNKLSSNTLSSNHIGHKKNDLENVYNHSMGMQCKSSNQTNIEVYSDLQIYPSEKSQQISKKELMPTDPISFIKIEDNTPNVYSKNIQNNSKLQNEVCVERSNHMEKREKTSFLSPSQVHDAGNSTSNNNSNSEYNPYINRAFNFNEYVNPREHQLSTIIPQDKKERNNWDLKESSQYKIPVFHPKNTTSNLEASLNTLHDSKQVLNKNPAENDFNALKKVIKIERN